MSVQCPIEVKIQSAQKEEKTTQNETKKKTEH